MPDPITQTYQALWRPLIADAGFAALVGPGQRLDLSASGSINVPQGALGPAQLPQVMLLQGAFSLRPLGRNARVAEAMQSFTLAVATDGLHIAPLNQIKYRALVALANAGPTLDLPFVRDYVINHGADEVNQAMPLFAKIGALPIHWASLMHIQVNLYFERAALV